MSDDRKTHVGDPDFYRSEKPLSTNGKPIEGLVPAQSNERPAARVAAPPVVKDIEGYAEREFVGGVWDHDRLGGLYNKFKGERCFIVGNGPSLNKHDLSLLEGEYTFAVNSIFYKTEETGFRPTFFVVEDTSVMKENLDKIKAYEAPYKFFPTSYRAMHGEGENVYFFRMNRGFYEKTSPNFCIPRFSTDASKHVFCGQSVTYINLQLAYFMGFTEVHLIGMDFDYQIPPEDKRTGDNILSMGDDRNHFHKDYFGKGKTWKDPKLERVAANYREARLVYDAVGRQIYNATIGGKLEIFDRVDYEQLLRDPATGKKRQPQDPAAATKPSQEIDARPVGAPGFFNMLRRQRRKVVGVPDPALYPRLTPAERQQALVAARAIDERRAHTGDPDLHRSEPPFSVNGTYAPIFPPNFTDLESYEAREWAAGKADRDDMAALYNRFEGERCFIIGNGPSLNRHDLSLLKDEYTFAVNSFYYKTEETGFRPTFFVVEDTAVMADNLEKIRSYAAPFKFFPSSYRKMHGERKNVHFFRMNRGFYEKSSPNYCIPRFSADASSALYCGQSVTYINLQLAFFMGFTEVYLIGMDFDYTIPDSAEKKGDIIRSMGDDPNHFHKDYFGKGKIWKDPKLERVALNYLQAQLSYEAVGRKIYNATIGGKLEIFPRVDYGALLAGPPRIRKLQSRSGAATIRAPAGNSDRGPTAPPVKRRVYADFAERLEVKSPRLFRILQRGRRLVGRFAFWGLRIALRFWPLVALLAVLETALLGLAVTSSSTLWATLWAGAATTLLVSAAVAGAIGFASHVRKQN